MCCQSIWFLSEAEAKLLDNISETLRFWIASRDDLLLQVTTTNMRCLLNRCPKEEFWNWSGSDLQIYTHWTRKLSPLLFSPLDPIVNGSCKNCCVGSLIKIFHPNMMLIYHSWHKLTSFVNRIFIDKFPLFWTGVKDLQGYLRTKLPLKWHCSLASDTLANY